MKHSALKAALLLGFSSLAATSALHAQSVPASPPAPDDAAAAAAEGTAPPAATNTAATAAQATDIIVTGSRVTTGNNSPTPLTAVTTDKLLSTVPSNLADALNTVPVFSGSQSTTTGAIGAFPPGGGNGAANLLNLRNLGANRNLILIDGERVPTATFTGAVDVDLAPEMLIKRVDVVTGGVSAVYGSDAVSGVVNFVTDDHFNGIKVQAQRGISTYGDDPSYKVGIAAGKELFGGRGHIEFSYTRFDDAGILSSTERPNYPTSLGASNLASTAAAGTAANPYTVYRNVGSAGYTYGGLITNGLFKNYTFAADGAARPFVNGASIGTAGVQMGGDTAFRDQSLKSALTNNQLFARFDYDVTDDIKFHAKGIAEFKENLTNNTSNYITNVTVSASNPYLPTAMSTALAAAGQSSFTYSKIFSDLSPFEIQTKEQQYYGNVGLSGKTGIFDWGLDFNYGHTRIEDTYLNDINNQNLAAALDSVVDPATGAVVCRSALTSGNAGCVPLNPFGPTAASAASLNYITGTTKEVLTTNLYDIAAHVAASPFSTWAGPVRIALSGEWRRNTLAIDADASAGARINCTGLTANCSATGTLFQNTLASFPEASQTVKEVALETNIPLLRDFAIAKSLDVNAAGRFTDYNTSGKYWTWKVGLNWQVDSAIRLRGTISRDIRAPTLYDLFQPVTSVPLTTQDLLTGLQSTAPSINSGNPNLKAEIGRTETAGIVLVPSFLHGFSLSVDYYHIKVSNAISSVHGWDSAIQQACYATGGSSPYCALQDRPINYTDTSAANLPTAWYAQSINIAQIETMGVDTEVNYLAHLFDRPVQFRLFATYQPHIYYRQPNVVTIDMGGAATARSVGAPRLKITGNISAPITEHVALQLQERWRSSLRFSGNPNLIFAERLHSVAYTDATVNFYLGDPTKGNSFFVNVVNLTNKLPPAFAYAGAPGVAYSFTDDPVGRYFTAGIKMKF